VLREGFLGGLVLPGFVSSFSSRLAIKAAIDDDMFSSASFCDVRRLAGFGAEVPFRSSVSNNMSRNRFDVGFLRSHTSLLLQDAFPVFASCSPARVNRGCCLPDDFLLGSGKCINPESLMLARLNL